MTEYHAEEQLIELLLIRLERISADSHLAHRASGMRGALLNAVEQSQQGRSINKDALESLINMSFLILERAAAGSTYARRIKIYSATNIIY
jgi:hypothetical protein